MHWNNSRRGFRDAKNDGTISRQFCLLLNLHGLEAAFRSSCEVARCIIKGSCSRDCGDDFECIEAGDFSAHVFSKFKKWASALTPLGVVLREHAPFGTTSSACQACRWVMDLGKNTDRGSSLKLTIQSSMLLFNLIQVLGQALWYVRGTRQETFDRVYQLRKLQSLASLCQLFHCKASTMDGFRPCPEFCGISHDGVS